MFSNLLLRLFVQDGGVAPLAVFLDLELLGLLLLVDGCGVVAPLALSAGESDNVCHDELVLSCT